MWHNELIRSELRQVILQFGREHLRGRMIDIGCGDKQYETLLAPYVTEHVGVDHDASIHGLTRVDVVATAYEIPLPAASFDSALMTEVLEHLEEPVDALRECWRLLRPGGAVVITVPFIWHVHEEPRDFYRYTPYGLRHILDAAGFEVGTVRLVGGFWTTFGQLLAYNIAGLERGLVGRTGIVRLLVRGLLRGSSWLEDQSPRPAWASHVAAVGVKPKGSNHGSSPGSGAR